MKNRKGRANPWDASTRTSLRLCGSAFVATIRALLQLTDAPMAAPAARGAAGQGRKPSPVRRALLQNSEEVVLEWRGRA